MLVGNMPKTKKCQLQKAGATAAGGSNQSYRQSDPDEGRDRHAASDSDDLGEVIGSKYKNLASEGGKDDSIILNNRWFNKTTGLYVDCK